MTNQPSSDVEQQENVGKGKASKGGKRHVLVVDHNPVMGRILSKVLDRAGLKFSLATSGEEAVAFAAKTTYDLILMEVRMPGIGGREAMKQIRAAGAAHADTPIIAVSARLTDANIAMFREEGFSGELKKPVIELNLMQVLAEHLGIKKDAAMRKPPIDDEIYAVLDEDEMSLINWDTIKEYNAVLKEDYKSLMRDFLQASPGLIGDIGEAVVDQDGKRIEYMAHKLKSTSLIFGAETVSNVAAQLEILGRENNLEHANQFFKELHMCYERVQPVLRKKLVLMSSAI
jgi:CheY-like chemotaxis protein/HPt (histidine-containing phosphotransfer) domain-containing protein